MKKQNKIYSASDFAGMNSSILVEDTLWVVDHVSATAVGEFSKLPLFELQFKQLQASSGLDIPEGYEDASGMLVRNRTYYVREGRPLYNELSKIWEACEDVSVLDQYITANWSKKVFAGHVEKLTGIMYSHKTRSGAVTTSPKMEVWYPQSYEPGVIVDDFIYLCNKGVYTPVVDEKPDPVTEALSKLDPAVIAAIKAMK